MDLSDIPGWARVLVDSARVAHLGLVDDHGRPRVLPITFAQADGAIVSAIDDKPKRATSREIARVRWLRSRPQGALTVDHYEDDWTRLAWVQLLGRVDVVEADAADRELAALAAKYEPYRTRPVPGPVLRLVPQRAIWWRAAD